MRNRPSSSSPQILRAVVPGSPQLLSSWKEIAAYLGVSVRTAQLYEKNDGLPVRRPPGKGTGRVTALVDELDAWRVTRAGSRSAGESPSQAKPRSNDPASFDRPKGVEGIWKRVLPAAAVLVLAAAAWWGAVSVWESPEDPADLMIQPDRIEAVDGSGQTLWVYRPTRRLVKERYGDAVAGRALWVRLDVDGDGRHEFLVPELVGQGEDGLLCLDAEGSLLWRRELDSHVTVRAGIIPGPFPLADFSAAAAAEPVAVLLRRHPSGSPSLVNVVLAGDGTVWTAASFAARFDECRGFDLNGDGADEVICAGLDGAPGVASRVAVAEVSLRNPLFLAPLFEFGRGNSDGIRQLSFSLPEGFREHELALLGLGQAGRSLKAFGLLPVPEDGFTFLVGTPDPFVSAGIQYLVDRNLRLISAIPNDGAAAMLARPGLDRQAEPAGSGPGRP